MPVLRPTPPSCPVNLTLAVAGHGRLVVFDSGPSADVPSAAIAGREVFLFDLLDRAVWQIVPECGTTEGRSHPFDPTIATIEPFVTVWEAGGTYHASRFNGDTFRIDMATGAATYSGWART